MGCSSLVHRGCSSLCCTNQAIGAHLGWCTSCSGKRQSRAETSAPPGDTLLWMFVAIYLTAMHSTSTRAFFGRVFTATAERAGNG